MQTLTTAVLAKQLGLPSKELYSLLLESQFVYRKNDNWFLTAKGEDAGGKVLNSEHGQFIVWPQDFNPLFRSENSNINLINVTQIGEEFGVSNRRVNNICEELGWIEQAAKGWKITLQGRKVGGVQKEHQTGGYYVKWPSNILTNSAFINSIKPIGYIESKKPIDASSNNLMNNKTENKYPDTLLKATDGHLVRSRAELIIDNLLYDYRLIHAYERELTVAEETVLSDFYIPAWDKRKAVYIEFWGINDNEKYLERKKKKLEIYKTHKLNLINVEEKHLDNIDIYLRKAFLDFDINIE